MSPVAEAIAFSFLLEYSCMQCREGCGACCVAPLIVQPMPNMPNGKPAGQPCTNLDLDTFRCRVWGGYDYPKFCRDFQAEAMFCGENREEALQILTFYEQSTRPE